jgi:hypothetical protein
MNPRQYRELERQADVIEQNKKLNMKTFNDLVFNPHPINNGVVSRLYFGNGYGVSVVKHDYSYGNEKGLYELAVVSEETGEILYDTPITEDVVGWLRPTDVTDIMSIVQKFDTRK